MKELTFRIDEQALALLSQEIKDKRRAGRATSFGDILLIRLLESLESNNKVLLLKMQANKVSIRGYVESTQI